jgi:hypothetical protein
MKTTVAPDTKTDCGPYAIPTYCALMMARGGGVDLTAGTPAKLERQIEEYIADYRPEIPSDMTWNDAILAAVRDRDFVPYVRGQVRARWPQEEGAI